MRENRSFTTSEANLRAAFADQRGEIYVHLEAGELAPWAAAVIAPLVTRVVCSHPQSNAWIAKDADKCDRVDAYKLAELLRLNRFKEVHYAPDQARRNFKQLVQHYDELTGQQARLKTKIKARLRMQGVIVTGERLFSATGRKEVLARVEARDLRTAITQLYAVLDQSVTAQEQARMLMLRAAQAFPEIKLFRTAPGVGPIGACRFSAYIHTPSRFSTTRKLWKYCRQRESPQQQRQTFAPAATRSLRLWPFEGRVPQGFRCGDPVAPRQRLQACLSTSPRIHAR